MPILKYVLFLFSFIVFFSCNKTEKKEYSVNYKVHTFYYNWYGNPEHNGEYVHWKHDILPHWSDTTWNNAGGFSGENNNIGANYFPQLGTYSSNDTSIISKHMKWIVDAGIGVVAITWWGKDSYEDKFISNYLDIADKFGLKLVFHIEPFYKNAEEFRQQLKYLNSKYGEHPALYKFKKKSFYYVYDSYKLDSSEWKKLLSSKGDLSVRNTPLDATFIGLWVNKDEGDFFINAEFDGFYTYFASDGFVYGSTSSNWKELSSFAKENELTFVPCAGPGYIDNRIRPWNDANTKVRKEGQYYEEMFLSAVDAKPDFIGITSFNEWHEGTQIEPAISASVDSYDYEDYGENISPIFYLDKTRELIDIFKKNQ
ncbi:MAG: glycoprotein endo-alpha-1,2-mannosidase [Maribacter sp.]|jgi:glycoprotein endo-alpha-1,2-mannosidase